MNKKMIAVAMTAAAGAAVLGTVSAYAYRGDALVKGPNYTAERHEAMRKAFEGNDYAAWKQQMQGRGRVSEIVNEGNFARFSEMRRLMLEGKTEEAAKIRVELGLGQGEGKGRGQGHAKARAGRGTNAGGNFVDNNGDGKCDRL